MKRVLFLMLFGMTLLWGGCCRNVPQKGNELKPGRLVEQVVVRCGSKADCGEERITDPEKIRQILDLLRQLKLQGTTDTVPAVDPEQMRIELRDILARLPEMDRQLILLRHRAGLTQAQAGQRLGLTQMQVSRREAIIRTLLRRALAE